VSPVTRAVWWNVPAWLVLLLYAGAALGLAGAACGLARHVRGWRRGRPLGGAARFPVLAAVRRLTAEALGHRRLLEDPGAGGAHLLLVLGFLGLLAGTCLVFVHDRVAPFLVGRTYLVFSFLLEWAGLAFLGGTGWLAWQRLHAQVPRLERDPSALACLALLAAIGATGFLVEGARIAATDPPFERWSFVGWTLARGIRAAGMAPAPLHRALWGAHAVLSCAFLAAVGLTGLRHLAVGPLQLALRPLRRPGALAPALATPGALAPARLTWAQLLDASTCVRCGRCTAVCPATAAGQPLDPRRAVQATLQALRDNRPLDELLSPGEAWACTTCAACVHACPFEIEVLDKLVDVRRARVERGQVEPAAARALEAIRDRGTPWGVAPGRRLDWAEGLSVRVLRPGEATDVLYWVGCAGAADPHGRTITRAVARLLGAAGVDFAVLGEAERCTGDPARRLGEEGLFREAAGHVRATLAGVRYRRLLTHCAHCYHVFRHEYPGGGLAPVHHTQLLAELVAAGRLRPRQAGEGVRVTLHDPCYLARHNGETAAARALLGALPGAARVEMARSGRGTACCGAGGGGAWAEVPPGPRIATLRMAEARATGAAVVATACPFCALMLDGETGRGGPVVRDVAELLWASQPAGSAEGGPA
jgi:Fe-S oxidoreductase